MRSLLYIGILLVIAGCSCTGGNLSADLDDAAELMQTDPMAAMERLNQYDVAEFKDSALVARWALLYSEALVANRITAPADTIVDVAIDYYARHNRDGEYLKAARLKELMKTAGVSNAISDARYHQKEKELMLYKERVKRENYVFFGISLILVAAIIILWQCHRLRIKNMQSESLIAEASSLMDSLSRNESLCSDLQGKLSHLLANRFDLINQLCETYYEAQGTKIEKKAIVEKVKSQISELNSTSGLFVEMEKCVNACCDGLLERLRNEWPDIKEDDYRLAVYLSCNLSGRAIAALTGENIGVIYKRKSRLKAKIAALDSAYSDKFMSIF